MAIKTNYFKALFVFLLFIYILPIFSDPGRWNFLFSGSELMIHEVGHFIFGPFGETIWFLGGTLAQLLVPLGIVIYFGVKKDIYSSGMVLAWLGHSFVNVSVYMKDAIAMQLPLVGGDIHDWNFLFTKYGILNSSGGIADFFRFFGYSIIISGLIIALIFSFVEINKQEPKQEGPII